MDASIDRPPNIILCSLELLNCLCRLESFNCDNQSVVTRVIQLSQNHSVLTRVIQLSQNHSVLRLESFKWYKITLC